VTPSRPPPEAQDTPRKTPLPPAERLMAAAEEEEEGEGYRPMADPAGPLSRERREERKEQRARPRPTRGGGAVVIDGVVVGTFCRLGHRMGPFHSWFVFSKGSCPRRLAPIGPSIHNTWSAELDHSPPVGDWVPRRRSGPPSAIGSPPRGRHPVGRGPVSGSASRSSAQAPQPPRS